MASRNVADCKRHGQDRQAEGQSDSGEADPEARESRGQYRAPASAEDQPKGSDKFRKRSFRKGHTDKPLFSMSMTPVQNIMI